MEELSYVLTQYFVSCVHVRFYFSLPLIFTLLAASISHFLTAALNFHVFLARNSSPLFSITRFSSFSVIHVSVNIKNNAEKDTTLLLFFLSKSPGGHVISFQIKPWVAFGLPYLLIELFYIGMPVVRTDGRCTVTWLPNFLPWEDYHISIAMALRAALGAPLKTERDLLGINIAQGCILKKLWTNCSHERFMPRLRS